MKNKIIYFFLIAVASCSSAQTTQKYSIDLSFEEIQTVIKCLEDSATSRAPRVDIPSITSASYPVLSGYESDLALILSALCAIKTVLAALTNESGDTAGTCLPSIVTAADIENMELSAVGWLKTIMKELRGVCP